jgi:hypothetical protein
MAIDAAALDRIAESARRQLVAEGAGGADGARRRVWASLLRFALLKDDLIGIATALRGLQRTPVGSGRGRLTRPTRRRPARARART